MKEASLNFAENCKSISNSLAAKIALRLCISAVIPIKHIFQQADRKQDRWSSLSSNNMQNMIKNIQCTVSYLENAFIFLCFVHLLISTEIPHRWEFQIDNAFREEACNHQLGMWLIHKLKGIRWPTRFQRSKKGFVFWSLISGILLTQTWQRDCLRNTKSFSFIIFVSSSLLFFAGHEEHWEVRQRKWICLNFPSFLHNFTGHKGELWSANQASPLLYFKFVTIRLSFII